MGWAKVETSNFFGRFDGKFFLIPENISLVDNLRALPWSKVNVHQPAESTMVTCGSNDKTRAGSVGSRLTKQGLLK